MQLIRRFVSWRTLPMALLLLVAAGLWLAWPVIPLDYDIWYHLTGGAYILKNLALPNGPFFSYLSVPTGWVDYYWLFQVLVEGLFQCGGYVALVVLRAVVYLATLVLLYRYFRNCRPEDEAGGYLLAVFAVCAYALALIPRELLLRPHAFTYLYIVVLHFVLNFRKRLVWGLPLATVVWVNLHGVEYPVIMLVCGAYLGEYFVDKLLRRPEASRLRAARWPLILSFYAVLATPAGIGLLPTPFDTPPFHERGVVELARQSLDKFLGGFFYPDGRLVDAATNMLVVSAVAGAIWLALARRLRLSRLVLLAGGLVLLPMMRRFTFEFMLLTLPILGDAVGLAGEKLRERLAGWTSWVPPTAAGCLVAITLMTMYVFLGNRPAYPVELSRLPVGVCDFLMREGPGGRIYNVPNPGGYLQWRLYPKYRIGMDMETMLFPSQDFYSAIAAFHDPAVLGRVLDRYQPTLLLGPLGEPDTAKTVAAFPRFVPIFFDDVLVLYADATAHPELVKRFRLEAIQPTAWQTVDYEAMSPEKKDKVLAECRRLLDISPGLLTANTIAAKVLLSRDDTAQAKIHADVLIRRFPDRYMGFALKGVAEFKESRYEEALALYRQALQRALPVESIMVRRNIYAAEVRLKRFDAAYKTLLSVCNPMSFSTSAKDLYDLSLVAEASGHARQARVLLDLAGLRVSASDAKLAADIEEFRRLMPPGS